MPPTPRMMGSAASTEASAVSPAAPRPRAALYVWQRDPPEATRAALESLGALARGIGDVPFCRYVERVADAARCPRLRLLLGGAEQGHFDVVHVETVDALGVGPASILRAARRLAAVGVRLVSAAEPWFDLASPWPSWLAEAEERRLRRAAQTRETKRRAGESVGELPFGKCLAADGIRLEPDEREQQIIGEARLLRAQGWSLRQIALALTRSGYTSRAGTPLTHRQVGRMLLRIARPTATRS